MPYDGYKRVLFILGDVVGTNWVFLLLLCFFCEYKQAQNDPCAFLRDPSLWIGVLVITAIKLVLAPMWCCGLPAWQWLGTGLKG